ncbi:helix-turn-helix domain-containing protein [Bacteroides sp. 51]|uniref:helix-turn-helix domain-containing protein n=1 Tax=Bacteroides sp. 51 TaxID=2302938 RepID=UPI0013D59034|nr:helix-turn-helix domain-containing protein [Bacteroides sp. 51]NDV81929.1 AraC family transcriptional regulator [Bacteroides sp. 51]
MLKDSEQRAGMNSHTELLRTLSGEQFIEVYSLEEAEGGIFDDYQRYDFHQVIWFMDAGKNNTYFLDFNEYTIQDNQVVVLFPGQIDMLDIRDKQGYVFAIHNDNFFNINQRLNSDLLNGYFSNVFISLPPDTKDTLQQLLQLMLKERDRNNRILLMESYMQAFLYHICSLFDSMDQSKNRNELAIGKLMRLIDTNFIHQRESDFYARQLGVSIRKLNETSTVRTGKTVKQHLQDRLILEIKKEIRLGQKSLKEIAFDLGFSEPAYFTRFFKQQTGTTPTEFRDQ